MTREQLQRELEVARKLLDYYRNEARFWREQSKVLLEKIQFLKDNKEH